jgi:hypothetical protein
MMNHRTTMTTTMTTTTCSLLGLLGCVAALGGCVVIDVDAPEVCVADMRLTFADGTHTAVFAPSDPQFGLPDDLVAEVEVQRAHLRMVEGVGGFELVRGVDVGLASTNRGSALPVAPLARFTGDDAPTTTELSLEGGAIVALDAYVAAGGMEIVVTIDGDSMPEAAWTADLDVCFAARASYKLGL